MSYQVHNRQAGFYTQWNGIEKGLERVGRIICGWRIGVVGIRVSLSFNYVLAGNWERAKNLASLMG